MAADDRDTSDYQSILIRVSGLDRPGLTTALLSILASADVLVDDMEQVVVRERLTLGLVTRIPPGADVLKEVLYWGWDAGIQVDFELVEATSSRAGKPRYAVTVLAHRLTAEALAATTGAIAEAGGNIDRIVRLSKFPVTTFEFLVVDGNLDRMRALLVAAAERHRIDVAVQRELFGRRAKQLIVLDVDSTLIQGEMIDLLADRAGVGEQVAQLTERAMAGELDFEAALRERVSLLKGLTVDDLEEVASSIKLTRGARTFVRTLKRLGYSVALVSGGFNYFTERLTKELGLTSSHANTLVIEDGIVTGELTGEIVDRAGKARILRELAAAEGLDLAQTVAVGDGANDLDMLAAAGLGIAFNAKPVVTDVADTRLTVPYLDAILFMLGIRRDDVELADRDDGIDGGLPQGDPRLPKH